MRTVRVNGVDRCHLLRMFHSIVCVRSITRLDFSLDVMSAQHNVNATTMERREKKEKGIHSVVWWWWRLLLLLCIKWIQIKYGLDCTFEFMKRTGIISTKMFLIITFTLTWLSKKTKYFFFQNKNVQVLKTRQYLTVLQKNKCTLHLFLLLIHNYKTNRNGNNIKARNKWKKRKATTATSIITTTCSR